MANIMRQTSYVMRHIEFLMVFCDYPSANTYWIPGREAYAWFRVDQAAKV